VDNKKRNASSADLKITVPVYQKDRFEIARPVVPVMVYAGEENSITMSYVNKGKSDILNVEAALEGNVDTYTPVQNIGNLEPGKSGTIAFSVTALEAGEAEFTITVTYEDANGDTKTREFPVTMGVEEMVYDDPGWEEPMPEPEPEKTGPSLPVILGIAAAILIAAIIIIRKRKKAAALKKEAAMWDSWDDDMTGGGSGTTGGSSGSGSAATGTEGASVGAAGAGDASSGAGGAEAKK
ncbi:MAG: CARDB domain-containing protein, partial [Anaerovoracaceae bacterium]